MRSSSSSARLSRPDVRRSLYAIGQTFSPFVSSCLSSFACRADRKAIASLAFSVYSSPIVRAACVLALAPVVCLLATLALSVLALPSVLALSVAPFFSLRRKDSLPERLATLRERFLSSPPVRISLAPSLPVPCSVAIVQHTYPCRLDFDEDCDCPGCEEFDREALASIEPTKNEEETNDASTIETEEVYPFSEDAPIVENSSDEHTNIDGSSIDYDKDYYANLAATEERTTINDADYDAAYLPYLDKTDRKLMHASSIDEYDADFSENDACSVCGSSFLAYDERTEHCYCERCGVEQGCSLPVSSSIERTPLCNCGNVATFVLQEANYGICDECNGLDSPAPVVRIADRKDETTTYVDDRGEEFSLPDETLAEQLRGIANECRRIGGEKGEDAAQNYEALADRHEEESDASTSSDADCIARFRLDMQSQTVAALREYAKENGVRIPRTERTKAAIVAVLVANYAARLAAYENGSR